MKDRNEFDEFDNLIKNFKLEDKPEEPRYIENPYSYKRSDESKNEIRQNFKVDIEDNGEYKAEYKAPAPNTVVKRKAEPVIRINRWVKAIIMLIATLVFCCFFAFFILESANDLLGLNQEDIVIDFEFNEGTQLKDLIEMLSDKDIISQPLTFNLYAQLKKAPPKFQPGKYVLNKNMSYDEIIFAFITGNTVKEEVRITFYEGMTVKEIANLLEKERVCQASEFLEYIDTGELNYEFVQMIPEDTMRFRRLEGYVFPDTYDFYVNEKVSSVAKRFLSNFETKISEEMYGRMKELNMSLDETITLASIIQKEASHAQNMKPVSAVFHNRINDSKTYPKLQSDVTSFYVRDDIKPFHNIKNDAMYEAYDTYYGSGLPVGPISNPGVEAINAALYPEKNAYNYFVTDKNGVYYYAVTLAEHEKNVRIAKAEGDVHGVGVQEE